MGDREADDRGTSRSAVDAHISQATPGTSRLTEMQLRNLILRLQMFLTEMTRELEVVEQVWVKERSDENINSNNNKG